MSLDFNMALAGTILRISYNFPDRAVLASPAGNPLKQTAETAATEGDTWGQFSPARMTEDHGCSRSGKRRSASALEGEKTLSAASAQGSHW